MLDLRTSPNSISLAPGVWGIFKKNMGKNRGQMVASSKDDANTHNYGVIDRQNWQNRGAV